MKKFSFASLPPFEIKITKAQKCIAKYNSGFLVSLSMCHNKKRVGGIGRREREDEVVYLLEREVETIE